MGKMELRKVLGVSGMGRMERRWARRIKWRFFLCVIVRRVRRRM